MVKSVVRRLHRWRAGETGGREQKLPVQEHANVIVVPFGSPRLQVHPSIHECTLVSHSYVFSSDPAQKSTARLKHFQRIHCHALVWLARGV